MSWVLPQDFLLRMITFAHVRCIAEYIALLTLRANLLLCETESKGAGRAYAARPASVWKEAVELVADFADTVDTSLSFVALVADSAGGVRLASIGAAVAVAWYGVTLVVLA